MMGIIIWICLLLHADPSGFILFPLVIHSFDLIISSVGIFSIRGTRDPGVIGVMEDPMMILQKGYSVTIVLAVVTFGLVSDFFFLTYIFNLGPSVLLIEKICGTVDAVDALHRTSSFCLVEFCTLRFGWNHDSIHICVDYSVLYGL